METTEQITEELNEVATENQNEKYIRLYADFENYKKRVAKEKNDLVINTKFSLLYSLLELDNDLSISTNHIKDEDTKNVVKEMLGKIEAFLNNNEIYTVQTDTYDPEVHEVISILKDESTNIINVASKGYRIKDKIIKHPKVILG